MYFLYYYRQKFFEANGFEPFSKFLSNLKDDEWKNVRSIISTTFTSGKLKLVRQKIELLQKNT
jgi:hypothetical protein